MNELENLNLGELIAEASDSLARSQVPQARLEAMSLIGHVIGRDRTYLITHPESLVAPVQAQALRQLVAQRAAGKPLQYITGHQNFYGHDFEVTPDVLIPRPETEILVEAALELLGDTSRSRLICDVGIGSGCIAVSLLRESQFLSAVGTDASFDALRVAARNAERHGVHRRLSLVASECFAAFDSEHPRFSMIVSNPPYIPGPDFDGLQREVRDHEPRLALTPGGDGLRIIRQLLIEAPCVLEAGGHLLMEIGFDQHQVVRESIDSRIWELIEIRKDLQGIPRVVSLRKI